MFQFQTLMSSNIEGSNFNIFLELGSMFKYVQILTLIITQPSNVYPALSHLSWGFCGILKEISSFCKAEPSPNSSIDFNALLKVGWKEEKTNRNCSSSHPETPSLVWFWGCPGPMARMKKVPSSTRCAASLRQRATTWIQMRIKYWLNMMKYWLNTD